jgi:hypothetical protein
VYGILIRKPKAKIRKERRDDNIKIDYRAGIMAGPCGHGSETSGIMKGDEFLEQPTVHHILKKKLVRVR